MGVCVFKVTLLAYTRVCFRPVVIKYAVTGLMSQDGGLGCGYRSACYKTIDFFYVNEHTQVLKETDKKKVTSNTEVLTKETE